MFFFFLKTTSNNLRGRENTEKWKWVEKKPFDVRVLVLGEKQSGQMDYLDKECTHLGETNLFSYQMVNF